MSRVSEEEYAALVARGRIRPLQGSVRVEAKTATVACMGGVPPPAPQQRVRRKAPKTDYKAVLLDQMKQIGLPAPELEYFFHPKRKWRADFHLPDTMILIEFEGGIFDKKGGHSSVQGILRDIFKYNEAALLGYTVIRVTPTHVTSDQALQWIERAYNRSK